MDRRTTIAAGLLAAALSLTACAGEPAKRAAPRRPVGHGSVAEVIAALALERLPCSNPQNQPLNGFEEAVSCRIGTTEIALVHFADPATQAKPYEDAIRAAGEHGVFGGSWAAKVPTAGLAKRIAGALENTTYV